MDTTTVQTDFNAIMNNLFNGHPELLEHVQESDFQVIFNLAKERENNKHFLKPLKTLTLKPYTGTKNLWQAKKLFPGFHDGDLKNWDLDEPQEAGPEMKLKISEMQAGKNGTFQKIFDGNSSTIWIPQNRILQVVEEHYDELRKDGYANFFPVKRKDGTRFVVDVRVDSDGLYVFVDGFEFVSVWHGGSQRRVFVAE